MYRSWSCLQYHVHSAPSLFLLGRCTEPAKTWAERWWGGGGNNTTTSTTPASSASFLPCGDDLWRPQRRLHVLSGPSCCIQNPPPPPSSPGGMKPLQFRRGGGGGGEKKGERGTNQRPLNQAHISTRQGEEWGAGQENLHLCFLAAPKGGRGGQLPSWCPGRCKLPPQAKGVGGYWLTTPASQRQLAFPGMGKGRQAGGSRRACGGSSFLWRGKLAAEERGHERSLSGLD